jgi:lipopolysaccharide assembly protein B
VDFEGVWVLVALPVAFGLGWLASRWDWRQLRLENKRDPKAYFRGLNYLLNEQQDRAIDAFIEAVQSDPDTTELHFALGSLFRRRGDFDRAVRVHEHLLARADLNTRERERAQYDLGLDYLRAGLFDRAEAAFAQLADTRFAAQAAAALLQIHERSRDWSAASAVARGLAQSGQSAEINAGQRLAHYACELALTSEEPQQARARIDEARASAPEAVRPRVALADWFISQGQGAAALDEWIALCRDQPAWSALVAPSMVAAAQQTSRVPEVAAALERAYTAKPTLDVMQAMVELRGDDEAAHQAYVAHLESSPSLVAAARWLRYEKLEHEQFHPLVQRALDQAVKPLERYRCAACGFVAQRHFWQCPGCQSWDSFPPTRVEEQ